MIILYIVSIKLALNKGFREKIKEMAILKDFKNLKQERWFNGTPKVKIHNI
jgi:hypothetical protein